MRDTNHLKEKYEVSLDSRQIVTLTGVGVMVLSGTFVLGVLVGKKLAAGALSPPVADLLTEANARTQALEAARGAPDAALTFHEELTRPAEPSATPRPAAAPARAEAPAPAPTPVAAAVSPDAGKPAPLAASDSPAPSGEVKAEPVPTRTKDGGGSGALKEAIGKAAGRAPETAADGQWTIQVSAYQERGEADRFAAGLRDKGYAPYVVEAEVPGRGTWYRVRMGRFASRDAAGRYLADFKRETQLGAIVTGAN
jgi:DedD protein